MKHKPKPTGSEIFGHKHLKCGACGLAGYFKEDFRGRCPNGETTIIDKIRTLLLVLFKKHCPVCDMEFDSHVDLTAHVDHSHWSI